MDLFLKRVGLVKQRSRGKELCEGGRVKVDGRVAKAGKEISPGRVIEIEFRRERIKIEVVGLPDRNYKKTQGEQFYKILEHERNRPLF